MARRIRLSFSPFRSRLFLSDQPLCVAVIQNSTRSCSVILTKTQSSTQPSAVFSAIEVFVSNSSNIRFWLASLVVFFLAGCSRSNNDAHAQQVANRVRAEFLHAWTNYERYAWGHDALRPLSKSAHDWYGEPLLMTPVDALDTLILMKLDAEAAKGQHLIDNDLSFDRDIYVKNFEITIRLLGGLLSSYELTGEKRLLSLAQDLGKRWLPVFNSPTGLPCAYVHWRNGQV